MNSNKGLLSTAGIAATLLITVVGCSGSKHDDYFPLKLGYQWVYKITHNSGCLNFTPSVVEADGQRFGVRTPCVQEITNLPLPWRYTDSLTGRPLYYTKSEQLTYSGDALDYLLLSGPLEVGKSWTWTGFNYKAIVLASGDVTVAAGTFHHCFEVRYDDRWGGSDTMWVWYAPGVGAVKGMEPACGYTYELIYKNF